MYVTRPAALHLRLTYFFTLCLCVLLCAPRGFAQAANLVIDSLQGEVDQNEVDTYISYMNGGVGGALLPTNALGDNLAYGTPGSTLEGLNYMYRITGDIPTMATEHMQLMNLAIVWSENFILLRNDQANGPHQVMWTGNVDPVWITYASTSTEAGYAGSENGDTAGHILYTALNILETPSIWNQTVPDGNPNHFGVTYLQRAQTYINMMEVTTQNYFTKYFINPATYQIVPPTSPAWTTFGENMDAWNRQFLLINDYLRLAQCHAILGDNPTLQTLYTNIVATSTNAFVANAQLVTGADAEAAYDWGYGNEGDLLGQITGESSSHASYDMQGIARVFEAGAPYTSATFENLERYASTIEYVLFDFAAYNASQTTAYYKTIDAGLPPVASGTATQDYLYPQFYFLTPYNTLFWSPAAYGAGIHNNYHNNPYMTAGILYSKHWVYNHTQSLIAVAANSQTVASGGTATYSITTNSTGPVTLSLTGLPAGATASFNPAVVSAGGISTLTVTTPSNSVNGSVLFTLVGTSGSSVQTLPLSLVVTAPDFAISVSSTSTVSAGSPGSFTVTINPSNGFTGNVTLSSDNNLFPAGTVATYIPTVITGGSGTSIVSVTTSATTTPGGEWSIGIIGTSGNIQHEGYSRLTVKNVPQTITFPTIPNVVYGTTPISLQASAGSNLPVTYTVTGPAVVTGTPTLRGQQITITGAGTVTVTANQSGNSYYSAATAVVQTFSVARAALTVTAQNASATYGAALPPLTSNITGFVNGDTSAVVSGAASVTTSATAGSPAGIYPITVSQDTLAAANYTFNFVNGTLTISAPMTLQLSSNTLTFPGSTNVVVTVTNTNQATPSGTVALYDGTTLLTTLQVQGNGAVYWYISPSLAVGQHNLQAVYSGNAVYPAGSSPVVPLTVLPAPVTLSASCWNASFPYGANYTCTTNLSSSAGSATGMLTYTVDGTSNSAPLSNSNAEFTLTKPNAGSHNVTLSYAAQGNFAAASPVSKSFTVTQAPTQIQVSPSSYYQSASTPLTLTASLTSWSAGAPTDGSVAFYDGATLLGTVPAGATVTFTPTGLTLGTQSFSAVYSPGASGNYAAATSSTVNVQLQ